MRRIEKRDWILILGILVLAAVLWLCLWLFGDRQGDRLRISVDGQVYGEYALDEDREIRINRTNTCRIREGSVTMQYADCPDQICVKHRAIDGDTETITCLPNRVVLEIIASREAEVDTIAK